MKEAALVFSVSLVQLVVNECSPRQSDQQAKNHALKKASSSFLYIHSANIRWNLHA